MDSRSIVPNFRNISFSSFLRIPSFAPTATASGCYQRSAVAAVRGFSWLARPRKLCLISKPMAAMRDFGAVGELPSAKPNFYQLLGIPASASYADIKRTYKNLARKYHPDVSPPNCTKEYTRRFIEVKEAYETLSDSSHRALYDRHLARGLQQAFSTRRHFDKVNLTSFFAIFFFV